jgi:hypothetical protein
MHGTHVPVVFRWWRQWLLMNCRYIYIASPGQHTFQKLFVGSCTVACTQATPTSPRWQSLSADCIRVLVRTMSMDPAGHQPGRSVLNESIVPYESCQCNDALLILVQTLEPLGCRDHKINVLTGTCMRCVLLLPCQTRLKVMHGLKYSGPTSISLHAYLLPSAAVLANPP